MRYAFTSMQTLLCFSAPRSPVPTGALHLGALCSGPPQLCPPQPLPPRNATGDTPTDHRQTNLVIGLILRYINGRDNKVTIKTRSVNTAINSSLHQVRRHRMVSFYLWQLKTRINKKKFYKMPLGSMLSPSMPSITVDNIKKRNIHIQSATLGGILCLSSTAQCRPIHMLMQVSDEILKE